MRWAVRIADATIAVGAHCQHALRQHARGSLCGIEPADAHGAFDFPVLPCQQPLRGILPRHPGNTLGLGVCGGVEELGGCKVGHGANGEQLLGASDTPLRQILQRCLRQLVAVRRIVVVDEVNEFVRQRGRLRQEEVRGVEEGLRQQLFFVWRPGLQIRRTHESGDEFLSAQVRPLQEPNGAVCVGSLRVEGRRGKDVLDGKVQRQVRRREVVQERLRALRQAAGAYEVYMVEYLVSVALKLPAKYFNGEALDG